jgi:hypothetical protein
MPSIFETPAIGSGSPSVSAESLSINHSPAPASQRLRAKPSRTERSRVSARVLATTPIAFRDCAAA